MVYWNLAYFKQLYEQYTTSGTNARTFCQLQGINENRFYYWIHKLKLNATSSRASNAIPVAKAPKEFIPLTSKVARGLTGVSLKAKSNELVPVKSQDLDLQLTYPNGVVLEFREGFDIEVLKELITLIP